MNSLTIYVFFNSLKQQSLKLSITKYFYRGEKSCTYLPCKKINYQIILPRYIIILTNIIRIRILKKKLIFTGIFSLQNVTTGILHFTNKIQKSKEKTILNSKNYLNFRRKQRLPGSLQKQITLIFRAGPLIDEENNQ